MIVVDYLLQIAVVTVSAVIVVLYLVIDIKEKCLQVIDKLLLHYCFLQELSEDIKKVVIAGTIRIFAIQKILGFGVLNGKMLYMAI